MPYIVIEGTDFSGKSTLIGKITEKLKEEYGIEDIVLVREPSEHNDRCKEIRRLVTQDKTLTNEEREALFIEARIAVLEDLVLPALAEGKLVIGDRSFISTVVYQSDAKGSDMNKCFNRNIDALEALGNDVIPNFGVLCEITFEEFITRSKTRDSVDVLEAPMLEKARFDIMQAKYQRAMSYCRVLCRGFNYTQYSGDVDATVREIASVFKFVKPSVQPDDVPVTEGKDLSAYLME